MYSFVPCANELVMEREMTLEDRVLNASPDSYLTWYAILGYDIEDEGQRLMLTFDYLNDRSFYLEMKTSEPGKNLIEPLVSSAMGHAPQQESVLEVIEPAKINAANKAVEEFDDEFYGSDSFNDDEFEAGGFSDMTLEE